MNLFILPISLTLWTLSYGGNFGYHGNLEQKSTKLFTDTQENQVGDMTENS